MFFQSAESPALGLRCAIQIKGDDLQEHRVIGLLCPLFVRAVLWLGKTIGLKHTLSHNIDYRMLLTERSLRDQMG
jgi:hypothetical protein